MTDDNAIAGRFVLVLVLERCCLQKRRVNPIRSAFPELPRVAGCRPLYKMAALSIGSGRLPGITQRNVLPIASSTAGP